MLTAETEYRGCTQHCSGIIGGALGNTSVAWNTEPGGMPIEGDVSHHVLNDIYM